MKAVPAPTADDTDMSLEDFEEAVQEGVAADVSNLAGGAVVEKVALREDLSWFWPILRSHGTVEQDWVLKWWQRWGYTAKSLIVLLLRRDTRPEERFPATIEIAWRGFARTFHPDFGEGGQWDAFVVGHGVRRGWWFTVTTNGWP